jgi:hypothetical protein
MLTVMVRAIAICCAAATAFCVFTADAADLDLGRVAGVYIEGFMNGNMEGGKYWSDDILEIVKLSPNTAYFRTYLAFFNGHQCAIWGVAEVTGPSLVYRNPETQCELHLDVADGKIAFDDKHGHCRLGTCGNRGMYGSETFKESFKLTSRRPIRYMPKLLASQQYLTALKDYQDRQPH